MDAATDHGRSEKIPLLDLCRRKGLKIRTRGEAVLTILDGADGQLSSKEIYFRAKAIDGRLTLSTISRMVADLAKAGLIQRLGSLPGRVGYVRTGGSGHHHMFDSKTGATRIFDCQNIEVAVRGAAAEMGFQVSSYRVEIIGEQRKQHEQ